MKGLLTALLLLCVTSSNAQTSVYHEFPDSNAYWDFDYHYYCYGGQGGSITARHLIRIDGDTTINGTNYKKLFKFRYLYFQPGICNYFPAMETGYRGAIREDISSKKVFMVQPDSTYEELLYDFNLQVGDTIWGVLNGVNYNKISSIDSVLVGSDYRKRWNDTHGVGKIIEGIGSTYGLLNKMHSVPFPPGWPDIHLICFTQNNAYLYGNPSSCYMTVGEVQDVGNLKVVPNPTFGTLIFPPGTKKPEAVHVLDLSGKRIISFSGELETIEIGDLDGGIYIVQMLYPDGESVIQKIILLDD